MQYQVLKHLLSFLNVNGHTKEAAWGNIVWGFLTLAEQYGLFSGKGTLQLAQGNVCVESQPKGNKTKKGSLQDVSSMYRFGFLGSLSKSSRIFAHH